MVSYLNPYRNFIDVSTKDGKMLLSNASDKFESPLIGNQCIRHDLGGKDFRLLKDISRDALRNTAISIF
jgi:hypothetical protein